MIVIITVLLAVLVMSFLWKHHQTQVQVGGYYDDDEDPYGNIRFWKVIDFLRSFWFTR